MIAELPFNPVASEFRRVRRQMERVNRRIAMADIPGKVIPGSQDYETRTMRLDLGRSADGRVVKGPKTPWGEAGAGKLRVHTPPKDNQQMRLRSPSGTVGSGSLADSPTFDADTGAPSQSGEESVLEFGEQSRIVMRDDSLTLSIGTSSIVMTKDRMILKADRIDENP